MRPRLLFVGAAAALFAANVGASNSAAAPFTNSASAAAVDRASSKIDDQLRGAGWSINSPIPEPLGVAQGSAVASADGSLIYYIGGITGALVATNKVRVYSPAQDTWFDAADIPVSPGIRTFGAAVELNGFIYVFGGFDGTNILDTTWIYDEANDAWSRGTSMPAPRFGSAVGTDGIIIRVVGGYEGLSIGDETNTIFRYTPTTNSWSLGTRTGVPLGRYHGVVLLDGSFRLLGGTFAGNSNLNLTAGRAETQIPIGLTDPAVATDGVRIYVAGGAGPAPRTARPIQILDSVRGTWSLGPPAPVVDNTSGVVANGTLYVLGGYDGSTPVSVNYSLLLSSLGAQETVSVGSADLAALDNRETRSNRQLEGTGWSINWPVPETYGVAQGSTLASRDGSLIYHIGGWGGWVYNRVRVYSPADDSRDASAMRSPWWDAASVPISTGIRSYGSAVELNGFIYVFGGVTGVFGVLTTTWIYDEANDSWSRGADMPTYRFGSAVATDGEVIWVMGGYVFGPTNTVWRYNPATDSYTTGFANMPMGLGRIHGVWLPDGTVHVLGGGDAPLGNHLVYDTAADAWSTAPSMPFPVLDPATVTDGTLIYLAGAPDDPSFPRPPGHTQVFDPATGFWWEGPRMPSWPRWAPGGIDNTSGTIANDVFYVMGGYNGGGTGWWNYSIPLSELRALNR